LKVGARPGWFIEQLVEPLSKMGETLLVTGGPIAEEGSQNTGSCTGHIE